MLLELYNCDFAVIMGILSMCYPFGLYRQVVIVFFFF